MKTTKFFPAFKSEYGWYVFALPIRKHYGLETLQQCDEFSETVKKQCKEQEIEYEYRSIAIEFDENGNTINAKKVLDEINEPIRNPYYERFGDVQYNWQYSDFLYKLLEKKGWNIKCASGASMEAEKGDFRFHFFGWRETKWLTLEKGNVQIGECEVDKATTTKGIISMLEQYEKLSDAEIRKENIMVPWQDRIFYKNVVRAKNNNN